MGCGPRRREEGKHTFHCLAPSRSLSVPSWREPWPHTYVLRAAGDLQAWAGCGAGGLVWQAVFEGRADADPSAFAKEVSLSLSCPSQPCNLVGVGGKTSGWSALMRNEQKPKVGAAGSLLSQGGVWLGFVQQHGLSRRIHRTASIKEGIQVQEKHLALLMGGDCLVHVRVVDIAVLDKYSVGNSQKHLEICWDDSLDLKLPRQCACTSWSNNKNLLYGYERRSQGTFHAIPPWSKTGGANGQSSYLWDLELAFCCTSSGNSSFQKLTCSEFAHQNIHGKQSQQGHEHSQSISGFKT